MSRADIHIGDQNTIHEVEIFEAGVVKDITGATAISMKFKKPDGTILTKAGTLTGTPTDGKVQYISTDVPGSDDDDAGLWFKWAELTLTSGWIGRTGSAEFHVLKAEATP